MTTPEELAQRAQDFAQFLPVNSDIPAISPDYSQIQTPLMWGGIWQSPGLDPTPAASPPSPPSASTVGISASSTKSASASKWE